MAQKQSQGFGAIELVLVVVVVGIVGLLTWALWHTYSDSNTSPKAKSHHTITKKPDDIPANLNAEILTGTAYLSPNGAEGMSIQYSEVVDSTTYHPFEPLQSGINSGTTITNKSGKNIQLKDIKVGDNLKVTQIKEPCVSAATGSAGGCQTKISSIQDLSL